MRLAEVVRTLDPDTLGEVRAYVARDALETGRRGLSDHLWLDLLSGGGPGFVGVRVLGPDRTIEAYAQVSAAAGGAQLEALGAHAARLDAVETALDAFSADGGGPLTWWLDGADPASEALARAHGLAPERHLHEMRRPLPAERRAAIETRPFRPGTGDADAWLDVNNRAFAGHPEQGAWTHATLATRLAEPWFDADGFRLYEDARRLAGFCWTKIHPATAVDPRLGEIYVIAVDPDFAGRGLGRELTLAGLDWLGDRDVGTACLYVDAANTAALALYRKLGFDVHRTRTAFVGHVPKAPV